ncbi:phosphohistidine phosphatase SixA [Planctomycetota bacterium]|nr:histidine phosphatase family protein [Planctomycetota bacterium]GDY01394.1 phosphohistidine phosphatase SixA [Planctomycetota bacterium]
MIVWLLRHGTAEDSAKDGEDASRALTIEGSSRLLRAAPAWQRAVQHVATVYVSPLLRAQQTGHIFAKATGIKSPLITTPILLPSARPMLALAQIDTELKAGRQAIACIGHEPHLGCLLGLLLTGSERASLPFKKGLLVGVDFDSQNRPIGRLVFAMSTHLAASF